MKFKLCEWEQNLYHDSYGQLAYWDDDDGVVKHVEHWSTAWAGSPKGLDTMEMPTLEVVEKAVAWLADRIYDMIRKAEYADVFCPTALGRGERVRLSRNARHHGQKFPEGVTRGEVVVVSKHGQFYAKGYNKPGRDNQRVLVFIDANCPVGAGDKAWFTMNALRLDREPLTDEQLRGNAERLAPNCQFHKAIQPSWGGWLSTNWALDVLKKAEDNGFTPPTMTEVWDGSAPDKVPA